MKIAFRTPIRNADGVVMRENVTNDDNTVKMSPTVIEGITTVQAAQQLGYRDAFLDGNVVKRAGIETREVLLQHVCIGALTRNWPGEDLNADQKYDRWRIASRIRESCCGDELGVLDLEAKDVAKILEATDKWSEGPNAMIPFFARAREILNG